MHKQCRSSALPDPPIGRIFCNENAGRYFNFFVDIWKRRSKQISDNAQRRKEAFERCFCIESQIPPGTLRNVNNTLRRKLSGARLPQSIPSLSNRIKRYYISGSILLVIRSEGRPEVNQYQAKRQNTNLTGIPALRPGPDVHLIITSIRSCRKLSLG